MKLSYLIRGLPGHPLHPPLTGATIGAYTAGTVAGFASIIGVAEKPAAHAWWLALIVGLIATGPTAITGLADWLTISRGTPLWRTATSHLIAMVSATGFFLIAALIGHDGYTHGVVASGAYVLTLIGFGLMTVGGWIGGSIVYVHGMRVLKLVDEPAGRAVSPAPKPEKEEAEA
ncbi:MAG: DUF2231 domain-containing protein [Actinomycetota bacterium]|nr:DUF2231 domain-containing protein [Actinomycetota bacterium]